MDPFIYLVVAGVDVWVGDGVESHHTCLVLSRPLAHLLLTPPSPNRPRPATGMLGKIQSTMRRLGTMSEEELGRCAALEAAVAVAAAKMREEDVPLDDVPDEFLDPLLCSIMKDPVRLPTSNYVMDRASIEQHLLNQTTDPFNRQPLKVEDLVALPEMKAQIETWVAEAKAKRKAAAQG